MRFTFVTAALAAIAGIAQAQSNTMTKAASGSASGASSMVTSSGNPNVLNLCVTYALEIPPCGTTALLSLASKLGGCGMLDFNCQCAYSSQVQAVASSAVIANCGLNTALQVQGAAGKLCDCVSANNAPLTATSGNAQATGAAAPGFVKAKATNVAGVVSILGGAIAAGVGVVAAL